MQNKTNIINEPYGVQFNAQNSSVIDEIIEEDKYFSRHIVSYHYGCYGSDDEDSMNDFIAAVGDKIGYMPFYTKGIADDTFGAKNAANQRRDKQIEGKNNMNLKENYERFFGKINESKEIEKVNLTQEQKQRFANLSKILSGKYPNAPMTLKEGWVWFGNKKIEKVDSFLKKSSLQIQEQVRVFSNSGKKGLL